MGQSARRSDDSGSQQSIDSDLNVKIPGLTECIRGEGGPPLVAYPVYCDYRPGVSVVLIDSGQPQKYIVAVDPRGHHYIVSLPLEWFGYHRNILAQVRAAVSGKVRCIGGGWLILVKDSLHIYGESIDFGFGNHRVALRAFARAIGKNQIKVQ